MQLYMNNLLSPIKIRKKKAAEGRMMKWVVNTPRLILVSE